ncbi:hypothetical protein [Leptolyngbya sp. 7M]|uniref:hypothetical protein n=1 Tax=Leptolyngbya sp. 7M TaxID=2812896 RepID=UPI001B8C14CA|nr:hypothetical protein [Leptolyngbya sp. 7M]QYO67645.1 hypothetical protein JVX88_13140 [Leptolyngbya sp. 7M]
MLRSFTAAGVLLYSIVAFDPPTVISQTQSLPPALRRAAGNPDQDSYRQVQIQRTLEGQRISEMRRMEQTARADTSGLSNDRFEISEKDRRRFAQMMEPSPDVKAEYKDFLKQPRTGIFRIFPASECDEWRVVRVDGHCQDHVPGGSSNTFRPGSSTPDIHYINGSFFADGFFSLLIMTELGSMPIESVGLHTQGVEFLNSFEPKVTHRGASDQVKEMVSGIQAGGRTYSNNVDANLGTTYALRIVAYRNENNLESRIDPEKDPNIKELEGFWLIRQDKRYDVLIAFRVVREDANGSLTIVWKELARKKSPLINFTRNEKMSDIR